MHDSRDSYKKRQSAQADKHDTAEGTKCCKQTQEDERAVTQYDWWLFNQRLRLYAREQ